MCSMVNMTDEAFDPNHHCSGLVPAVCAKAFSMPRPSSAVHLYDVEERGREIFQVERWPPSLRVPSCTILVINRYSAQAAGV
jgi:hypothetical protein